MICSKYRKEIFEILEKIEKTQEKEMLLATEIVKETLRSDGLIYAFGCGHSHLVALDSFYRAGGLASVSAILDTDLMLHNGAAKSSHMEKMEEIAPEIFRRYSLKKEDCLFVISASGINGVPVEMARCAKEAGVKVIAITSMDYRDEKSRHSTGMHLYEAADVSIDCCVPHGDAVIDVGDQKMGSVSTIAGTFILQSVLMEAALECSNEGTPLPIYKSGNIEGGGAYNRALIDKYLERVKHL